MSDSPHKRLTGVWVALMLATVVSTWWFSKDAFTPAVGTALVMVVAAVKVRLVLGHFMELRQAPKGLRRAFDAWVLGCTAMILALYLNSAGGA